MIIKIRFANHVHQLAILVKLYKIIVLYAKVARIEYFQEANVNA